MIMKTKLLLPFFFLFTINSFAQVNERQQFIRTDAPVIALTRVRLRQLDIDGPAVIFM